jgi:hypothetical protein
MTETEQSKFVEIVKEAIEAGSITSTDCIELLD